MTSAILIILGLILGMLAVAFIMVKYMIVTIYIPGKNFREVDAKIQEVIPQFEGWGFPINAWEFYKSQISKGFKYENIKNMKIHFVCKPAHANSMLRRYPYFGGIMPCSWAVYETKDGKVYIAKMNIGLMSMIYPGFIGKIMKDVAKTEKEMLARIIENSYNSSSGRREEKREEYARV